MFLISFYAVLSSFWLVLCLFDYFWYIFDYLLLLMSFWLLLTLFDNFWHLFDIFWYLLQASGFLVHVVPESHQVHPLHHLAQLQVDHHQDPPLVSTHHLPCSFLLLFARIHHQTNARSLKRKTRLRGPILETYLRLKTNF